MNADTNSIIRAYLVTKTTLTDIVGQRIYCPRLPKDASLPALGYFTRGGRSSSYIPGIVSPSVQFDCWGISSLAARQVYRAVYDNLQGLEKTAVVVGGNTYYILSTEEEVQGQDLVDIELPNYFRVLAFFSMMIRAE